MQTSFVFYTTNAAVSQAIRAGVVEKLMGRPGMVLIKSEKLPYVLSKTHLIAVANFSDRSSAIAVLFVRESYHNVLPKICICPDEPGKCEDKAFEEFCKRHGIEMEYLFE